MTKFSWRRESSLTTSGSLKMDLCLVLTECLSRRILRFRTSAVDLIHSERVSTSTSSFFALLSSRLPSKENLEYHIFEKKLFIFTFSSKVRFYQIGSLIRHFRVCIMICTALCWNNYDIINSIITWQWPAQAREIFKYHMLQISIIACSDFVDGSTVSVSLAFIACSDSRSLTHHITWSHLSFPGVHDFPPW